MKKVNKKLYNRIFLLVVIIIFINIFSSQLYSYSIIDRYNKFLSDYESFSTFISTIYSIVEKIINIIGIKVIIFIILLTLASSFLTTIGIPKGRFNFVLSTLIIDVLWFIWNQSFNYTLINNIIIIAKINFIIFVPYIIVVIIKYNKYVLKKFFVSLYYSFLSTKKNNLKDKNELKKEILLLNEYHSKLMHTLLNDIIMNDKIKISLETKKMISELENILKEIKNV